MMECIVTFVDSNVNFGLLDKRSGYGEAYNFKVYCVYKYYRLRLYDDIK